MEKIAKFEKVSKEQFVKDWLHAFSESDAEQAGAVYEDIQLPRRATKGSAGYDFFVPSDFTVRPGEQILIPTGVRVRMVDG